MSQLYEPYDLVVKALASLSLDDRLPKFEENEVNDTSVIQGQADTSALSGILSICIPPGRVPMFISAFKAALEERKKVSPTNAVHRREMLAGKLIPRRKKHSCVNMRSDSSPPKKHALKRWH